MSSSFKTTSIIIAVAVGFAAGINTSVMSSDKKFPFPAEIVSDKYHRDVQRNPRMFPAEVGWEKIRNPEKYKKDMELLRQQHEIARRYVEQLRQQKNSSSFPSQPPPLPKYGDVITIQGSEAGHFINAPNRLSKHFSPTWDGEPLPKAIIIACEEPYGSYLLALKERNLLDEPPDTKIIRIVWFRKGYEILCLRIDGTKGSYPPSIQAKRLSVVDTKERRKGLHVLPRVPVSSGDFDGELLQINSVSSWNDAKTSTKHLALIKSSCDPSGVEFPIPTEDKYIIEQWINGKYQSASISPNEFPLKTFLNKQLQAAGANPITNDEVSYEATKTF